MTDYVLSSSITSTTDHAFSLPSGNDTVVVSAGVEVSTTSSADAGIYAAGTGAGNLMTIKGSVFGFFGIQSNVGLSTIIVEAGGSVLGTHAALSLGENVTVRNFGTVSGQNGILLSGALTSFVFNEGVIAATTGSAVGGGIGNDTIINNGTIDGVIALNGGDDTYFGRGGFAISHIPGFSSLIQLGSGNDWAYGGAGSEVFIGDAGNDFLDGGDGIDTAYFNNNSFNIGIIVDLRRTTAQDTGEGFDTLVSIENVTSTVGNDTLTGNGFNNVLSSGAGQDVLDGGAGNDTLIGGAGDDTLDGGTGQDTVNLAGASANYEITPTDSGAFTVRDKRDAATNQDGTDKLAHIRFLHFSDGETIALANAAPVAIGLSTTTVAENALTGTIIASLSGLDPDGDAISYSLASNPDGLFRIDGANLVLTGGLDFETRTQHAITVKATDAFGGQTTTNITLGVTNVIETTALSITGSAGADTLTGESGNDILFGLAGNDALRGEAGNDRLYGSLGRDTLWGGTGQDIFVFDTRPNTRTSLDRILDFNVRDDTLHLSKSAFSKISKKGVLAKSAFWLGTKAHDASDRIFYDKKSGAVFYDDDGNGAHNAIRFATLPKYLKLTEKDVFLL